MSTKSKVSLKAIRHLVHQLSEFGLNPTEWQLAARPSRSGEVFLRHRYEQNLELKGRVELNSPRAHWSQLSLISL